MGKRGPAPTPTPIKRLRGQTRPDRLNDRAPKPVAVAVPSKGKTTRVEMLPIAPADLGARAAEVWRRQVASMGATGVLTPVDADAMRAYCEAVERYEEASRLLRGSGPLVVGMRSAAGPDGKKEYVRNPLHQIVRDNAMLIRLFARDLGFVPSGREGLHPGGVEAEEDAFDAWLGTGG